MQLPAKGVLQLPAKGVLQLPAKGVLQLPAKGVSPVPANTDTLEAGSQVQASHPATSTTVYNVAMNSRPETKAARFTVGILAVLALVYGIWLCRALLADVVIAITLASAITPLVEKGEEKRIPRWLTVISCYIMVAAFYTSIGFLIAAPIKEQTQQFAENLPAYRLKAEQQYHEFMDFVRKLEAEPVATVGAPTMGPPAPAVVTSPALGQNQSAESIRSVPANDPNLTKPVAPTVNQDDMKSIAASVIRHAFDLSTGFLGLLAHSVLVLFLSAYFAISAKDLLTKLMRWLPLQRRAEVESLIEPIGLRMGGYVRGQLMVATAVGTFFAIGFTVMGLKYSIVLGVLAGVLNLVPYVGSLTATVLAIFVALNQSPALVFLVIGISVIEQTIESNFFVPLLLGKQIDLHPLVVFFSVLVGAQLGGVPGVFVFVPLTSAGLYLAERYYLKPRQPTVE